MHDPSALGESRLVDWLIDCIGASGRNAIPFHQFMDACLYHPQYGYYMQEQTKIGKGGDFYTSASIGTIMGEMLAARFAEFFRNYPDEPSHAIIEWGAGEGKLAADIAAALEKDAPSIYRKLRYTLVEGSPFHRRKLEELAERHPGFFAIVAPEDGWRNPPPRGAVIFCNELLDAFPVHRLTVKNGRFHEVYVTWRDGRFEPVLVAEIPREVEAYLHAYGIEGREGQTVEINLAADRWIETAVSSLEEGMLMAIDYGGTAEEIYAAHRHAGTLMCYYRHLAHDDPYRHIGKQDITAHVNFSACIRSGLAAGCTSYTFTTQKQFLLEAGILHRLQEIASADPFHPAMRRNRSIRQLLLSDGMSELFKVLTLYKQKG